MFSKETHRSGGGLKQKYSASQKQIVTERGRTSSGDSLKELKKGGIFRAPQLKRGRGGARRGSGGGGFFPGVKEIFLSPRAQAGLTKKTDEQTIKELLPGGSQKKEEKEGKEEG